MKNTRENCFKELAEIAFAIERKHLLSQAKTADLQQMAALARNDQKESEEFRRLDLKYRQPTVVDFGDEIIRASRVAEKLRKLKPVLVFD